MTASFFTLNPKYKWNINYVQNAGRAIEVNLSL